MNGIFSQAMSIIPKQEMILELFDSYTTTLDGLQVATYLAGTTIYGSAQSMTLGALDIYGFKGKLDALMFYLPQKVFVSCNEPNSVAGQPSLKIGASRLSYDNTLYILSNDYTDWTSYAGYVGVLGVREGVTI